MVVSIFLVVLFTTYVQAAKIDFDIQQQPIADALKEFAIQADLQIMFSASALDPEQ